MSSILGSFIAGQQAGQQQHKYRQEQSKLAQLRDLAPSVLAGDPAAYGQAAALDIGHANKLQEGRDSQLRRFGGFIKFIDEAKASGDPRRLSAAMREAAPYLQQLGAPAFDPNAPWTPEYESGWSALKAQYEGAISSGAGTQPTQFTALDLQAKAAGYQPGTQGYQDFFKRANGELARQSGAAIGYQKITGPDGREYLVATDPRGIGAQVVGDGTGYGSFGDQQQGGVSQAAPQRADMEGDIELANSMIAAGIPEAQVDAFLAQRGQRAPAPSAGQGASLPAGAGSASGNPFAGRAPEDQAAATERAKLQAQLDFMPQQQAIETQGAIDRAAGTEQAKARVERESSQRTMSRAHSVFQVAMQGVKDGLSGASTGPIVGRLPALSESQQMADGGVAAIQPILKSLFREAGEGTFTDKDQDLLTAMIPTRADHAAVREWKIQNIERIVAEKLGVSGGQSAATQGQQPRPQQSQPPVLVHSPAEYNALPAGALYTAPDGSTRRKK